MKELLPPDPDKMNEDRATWAMTAINAFQERTGTNLEDALSDLLCDLMHLADRRETFRDPADDPECIIEEFDAALQRARQHYGDETSQRFEKSLYCCVSFCSFCRRCGTRPPLVGAPNSEENQSAADPRLPLQ
jgi:hypothetical protein